MQSIPMNKRLQRLQHRTRNQIILEFDEQVEAITRQSEYTSEIDPFLDVLQHSLNPVTFEKQNNAPMVMTFCIQAPLELFHAAGIRPYQLACGSFAAQNLSSRRLPALTCPVIKSVTGMLEATNDTNLSGRHIVFPTTCDWVVKWRELMGLDKKNIYYMDLPHLREDKKASKKWLTEIYDLKKWLESITKQKIGKKSLLKSVNTFSKAYSVFSKLIELRRKQKIPSVHFEIIANALPYDIIENWILSTEKYIQKKEHAEKRHTPVYLAGSPIHFPNAKLLNLIEDATMRVTADDLCSMERIIPGAACYEDPSEYALLHALSDRTHKGCICPTFSDNDRRLNHMLNILEKEKIEGIIFHVLKGCHPFDIESVILENKLKALGYRYLKIETDYVKEDEQNIVTRLEAFKQTLGQNTNLPLSVSCGQE